jgi:hypothetical protein
VSECVSSYMHFYELVGVVSEDGGQNALVSGTRVARQEGAALVPVHHLMHLQVDEVTHACSSLIWIVKSI